MDFRRGNLREVDTGEASKEDDSPSLFDLDLDLSSLIQFPSLSISKRSPRKTQGVISKIGSLPVLETPILSKPIKTEGVMHEVGCPLPILQTPILCSSNPNEFSSTLSESLSTPIKTEGVMHEVGCPLPVIQTPILSLCDPNEFSVTVCQSLSQCAPIKTEGPIHETGCPLPVYGTPILGLSDAAFPTLSVSRSTRYCIAPGKVDRVVDCVKGSPLPKIPSDIIFSTSFPCKQRGKSSKRKSRKFARR